MDGCEGTEPLPVSAVLFIAAENLHQKCPMADPGVFNELGMFLSAKYLTWDMQK